VTRLAPRTASRLRWAYAAIIAGVILASFVPQLLSGHSPFSMDDAGACAPGSRHLLGADYLGRDVMSRTLAAGRISVVIGVGARLGSVIIGLAAGLLIGMSGGASRSLLNGTVEVFLAIPALLLAMALAAVLGEGVWAVMTAIVAGTWAPVARFTAARVGDILSLDYVTAARALGAGRVRIMTRHLVPALLPSLVPLLTTGIATSIMMEATLTFLGLGGSASVTAIPTWGQLIQEGSKFLFDAPWIIVPPSVVLMIVILCFNQIGDSIAAD